MKRTNMTKRTLLVLIGALGCVYALLAIVTMLSPDIMAIALPATCALAYSPVLILRAEQETGSRFSMFGRRQTTIA